MNLAYLTDIIILLTAAVIAVPLSRFAGLGTVPGFLIAGVVVGPSALGLIDNGAEISHLAELGVVLLLFVIGIELKPSRLWLMRRMVFGLGTLQVVVTGALISAAAYFVFGIEPRSEHRARVPVHLGERRFHAVMPLLQGPAPVRQLALETL